MVRRDHRQCLTPAGAGDVYDAAVVAVVVTGEVVEDGEEVGGNNQYKETASVTSTAT